MKFIYVIGSNDLFVEFLPYEDKIPLGLLMITEHESPVTSINRKVYNYMTPEFTAARIFPLAKIRCTIAEDGTIYMWEPIHLHLPREISDTIIKEVVSKVNEKILEGESNTKLP